MQRDYEYLSDIIEAGKIIREYVSKKSQDDFLRDSLCQDAVIRRLEIIGEAARRISEQTQQAFPELPWGEMIGMRNRLIHKYDDIDVNILWDTVTGDIPDLIEKLDPILKNM